MSDMKRLQDTLARIAAVDAGLFPKAQLHIDDLTKPPGSLGRLEEIAARLYAIFGGTMPSELKKAVCVFAGDHGVADLGVSAFPREVTWQMVLNFAHGGAAINVLARHAGAEVFVVDAGVAHASEPVPGVIDRKVALGTADFTRGPAMTREQAIEALTAGIATAEDCVSKGFDLLAPGDMGIANTTASSAVIAAASGVDPSVLTGRGTGIGDRALDLKIEVIRKGLAVNTPVATDGLDILAKVGGFEIGAIAGFILGCAASRRPVVVDGFISAAGAVLAKLLAPASMDYAFFSHRSVEPGHDVFYDFIGARPLIDFNMRLGEGTGATLCFHLVEAGLKMFNEMATFSSAGVSKE